MIVQITIELGNDACNSGMGVISVINKHQGIIWEAIDDGIEKQQYTVRGLIDRNGNTVGKMEVICGSQD